VTLSSILVPSSGCLFGGYPSSSCDAATSDLTRLRNHETTIDRTAATNGILNVASAYHDWNDFTTSFAASGGEATMAAEGRLLLIHWTPRIFGTTTQFRWPDIAAGTYDASYVIPTAQAMRDFGSKFFLAFHNEMNASSTEGGGTYGTDAEYASAAQHIHNVFVAQGATNVVWVFKPSGYTTTISRMNTLYPGDAYVDLIGFDPYGNTSAGDTAEYVLSTKYPMVNWATVTKSGSHTKPMMMAEWGKREVSGQPNAKAQFFADMRALLKSPPYDIIKAAVYFNGSANASECLNSSTTTLDGYKALAGDSFFNPDMSIGGPPVGQGSFRAEASKAFSNSAQQTLIYPATAQAGDGALLWHNCTRAELRQAAEGTNATSATVGNSGSKGSNPMSTVTSAPAPQYDTGTKHSGSSSWKANLAAQGTCSGGWDDTAFGSPSTYWGELFIDIPSAPTVAARQFQQESTAGTFQWGIAIDTDGKLKVRDNTGTNRGSTAAAITTGAQHRIEWQADWNGSTTTVQVRRYSGADLDQNVTITEQFTATAFTQAAAPGKYHAGARASSAITWAPFVDGFRLSKSGWIGPEGVSPVLTAPTGWTLVDNKQAVDGPVELISRLYRRVTQAGDPGSTITLNTDVLAHGTIHLVVYSGVDQTALVDVSGTPSTKTTDSTTVITPNATTTGTADLIISAAFTRDNPGGLTSSWTLPGGEAQRSVAFPTGTADGRVAGVVTDDGVTHAAGTYGTKTFTSDKTSYLGIGWTVGLLSTSVSTGQHVGFIYEPA